MMAQGGFVYLSGAETAEAAVSSSVLKALEKCSNTSESPGRIQGQWDLSLWAHIDRSVFNPSLTTGREEAPDIEDTVTAERENAVTEIVTPELEIPLAVNLDVPASTPQWLLPHLSRLLI
ncbi:hypothetical protein PAMP_016178 [Pampus punctatissimus]